MSEQENLGNLLVSFVDASNGGSILVRNTGAYVSRFKVQFNFQGQIITKDSGNFTSGVSKAIDIPAEAKDIYLKVEEAWFIASWSTIFTKNYHDPVTKEFEIFGTTLNPYWREM